MADAIALQDIDSLKDELGDLLLQVVYHARIAEEGNLFDFADVADAISAKMIRRHPHVFGDTVVADSDAQSVNLETIKAEIKSLVESTAPGKSAEELLSAYGGREEELLAHLRRLEKETKC